MAAFVDRTEELTRLRALYASENAELAVIYGRRRLGKTALVRESLADIDDAVVYQARQKTSALQRQQFIEMAADSCPRRDTVPWEVGDRPSGCQSPERLERAASYAQELAA